MKMKTVIPIAYFCMGCWLVVGTSMVARTEFRQYGEVLRWVYLVGIVTLRALRSRGREIWATLGKARGWQVLVCVAGKYFDMFVQSGHMRHAIHVVFSWGFGKVKAGYFDKGRMFLRASWRRSWRDRVKLCGVSDAAVTGAQRSATGVVSKTLWSGNAHGWWILGLRGRGCRREGHVLWRRYLAKARRTSI